MDMRELKALEIAARVPLAWQERACLVPSQSGSGKYRVEKTLFGFTCTCEDYQLRSKDCKHIIAARLVLERDGAGKAPPLDTSAVPKRPTYAQNWPAYNLAQTEEKHRLQVLLHDLCQGVPDLPPAKTGRKPHRARDAVFAMALKVYSTFSERRFSCDLQDAHAAGYLTRPVPGMKLHSFFDNAALTPILYDLIVRSSRPLAAVETSFAVDSSGFSVSRFIRWHDEKYGTSRSGRDWVKAHIICGTTTNVVTAVRIEGRDAADCPQFKPLLEKTAEGFRVGEVSADKAYLSVENVEAVVAVGGEAFIAPKSNTTGGAGGLFGKMVGYYQFRRDEFLQHYHKRSNVESTFSMVKAKFRDHVRSKTDAAMRNEVLCKILCHNLCCLIQSQCELGIEPVFWQNEPADRPDVLPMVRPG
jgi:transposase